MREEEGGDDGAPRCLPHQRCKCMLVSLAAAKWLLIVRRPDGLFTVAVSRRVQPQTCGRCPRQLAVTAAGAANTSTRRGLSSEKGARREASARPRTNASPMFYLQAAPTSAAAERSASRRKKTTQTQSHTQSHGGNFALFSLNNLCV